MDYGLHDVRATLELNWSWRKFRDPSLQIEAVNFRAVRKDTRDLLQDLRDVADDIQVTHAADELKVAKEQKKARRQAAKAAKAQQVQRLIRQKGWDALDVRQKRQAEKLLGADGIDQAEKLRQQDKPQARQLELF